MSGRLVAVVVLVAAIRPANGAGVVVLSNRTRHEVSATATATADGPRRITLPRGDLVVLDVDGATTVSYPVGDRWQTQRVEEGSIYAFSGSLTNLRLEPAFVLHRAGENPPATDPNEGVVAPPALRTLRVKILVDDQEPAVREAWEARLRKRIAAASVVLEKHCRVRLEVVAVGTWKSSATARDFATQLSDFERKVSVRPASLAIGFSSRPLLPDPSAPFVATSPLPLRTHVLIGEWFPLAEFRRLEVLLHELGHFLGAVHSPEAQTAMRPTPGDAQSAEKDFRIGYDPLNTLAMNLVAREALGPRPLRKLGSLPPATRLFVTQIYRESARLMPQDSTPEKYLQLLEDVPARAKRQPDALVDGARAVVAAVVAAADDALEQRVSGDRLSERCVQAAAATAEKLPESQRTPAFLLGLAVALDTSEAPRKSAATRGLWTKIEDDDERQERLKVVGEPTLHGQHALTRHFFVAAALTSVAGARAAEPGGIVRELFDGEPSSGFQELAAEQSGAALTRSLGDDPSRLSNLAGAFVAGDYCLSPNGLESGLSRDELTRRFGAMTDERFRRRMEEIQRRVAELPAYKAK